MLLDATFEAKWNAVRLMSKYLNIQIGLFLLLGLSIFFVLQKLCGCGIEFLESGV